MALVKFTKSFKSLFLEHFFSFSVFKTFKIYLSDALFGDIPDKIFPAFLKFQGIVLKVPSISVTAVSISS